MEAQKSNSNILGIYENCIRCNRVLKSEKSRYIGYGSNCKRIIDGERAAQQLTINDFIEEETEC